LDHVGLVFVMILNRGCGYVANLYITE